MILQTFNPVLLIVGRDRRIAGACLGTSLAKNKRKSNKQKTSSFLVSERPCLKEQCGNQEDSQCLLLASLTHTCTYMYINTHIQRPFPNTKFKITEEYINFHKESCSVNIIRHTPVTPTLWRLKQDHKLNCWDTREPVSTK